MRPSTALRICIVLEWVFAGLGIALSFSLEHSLPEPLRDWLAAEAERDIAASEIALFGVIALLLLCMLVGSVGMLFLQRWAAWLYLVSLLIGYALFPFTGPTVEHALADAVDELAILMSGSIIGLAFFSDALRGRNTAPDAASIGSTPAKPPPLS